ncbi:putative RNA-directed DNA polymerase [Aphis craccivora]|uniref:Putative RNA-directed DNA polymerase n=1 Tax=Aphis craccivora TaxID=307492 RepID=A0A6G0Y386_APHCR|nr:putative RNA-directed DNA polymerase [Aphis craccivora]
MQDRIAIALPNRNINCGQARIKLCVEKLKQGYTSLKILYPLLNHSSIVQMKCSLHLYRYSNKRLVNSLRSCLKDKTPKRPVVHEKQTTTQ